MKASGTLIRTIFATTGAVWLSMHLVPIPNETWLKLATGLTIAIVLALLLFTYEMLLKKYSLRQFNTAFLGIIFGYFVGRILGAIFQEGLSLSSQASYLPTHIADAMRLCLFLTGLYLGTSITFRAAEQWHLMIPFVKFTPVSSEEKGRKLLVDPSVLSDPRLIDLAITGIFDHQLLIPQFIIEDLESQLNSPEEAMKMRAQRSLEQIRKLESLPHLQIRYWDGKEIDKKQRGHETLLELARQIGANVLIADSTKPHPFSPNGIRYLNLCALSTAMRPVHSGEYLKIKIQRYGKEPRQGIGYLEDGAMVVVNGGGDYIGEIIETRVLSTKHTSSGRIIFCNAIDDESLHHEFAEEKSSESR